MEASSTRVRQVACFASGVGIDARASAARSRPVVVRSRVSSVRICSSPLRPAATRPISRSQRRSWSTSRPSRAWLPSTSPATTSSCSSVTACAARARTSWSCLSLLGWAARASPSSRSAVPGARSRRTAGGRKPDRQVVIRPSSPWMTEECSSTHSARRAASRKREAASSPSRAMSQAEARTIERGRESVKASMCSRPKDSESSSRRTLA